MTYEEMMQIEEAKVAAEQEAWGRLHAAIFRELFNKTDTQSGSRIGREAMNAQQRAHGVSSENELLTVVSCTTLMERVRRG